MFFPRGGNTKINVFHAVLLRFPKSIPEMANGSVGKEGRKVYILYCTLTRSALFLCYIYRGYREDAFEEEVLLLSKKKKRRK